MTAAEQMSVMGRLAAADEGVGLDELALAARNHGMPLEALRYDLTPAGLHYLLMHFDIRLSIRLTGRFGSTGRWPVR